MKRLIVYSCLLAVGTGCLLAETPVRERRSEALPKAPVASRLDDFAAGSRKAPRKAQQGLSIEGLWKFSMGDYFFDDSSMQTLEFDLYAASYGDDVVYFTQDADEVLPMAAHLDEATGELTFSSGQFGDFYGYGVLVQLPSVYDPQQNKFTVQTVTAMYDAGKNTIEFPENSGIQWWLYDYHLEPMFSLDSYLLEGARKIGSRKVLDRLVINQGYNNVTEVMFDEFDKIYFADGNIVFEGPDTFRFPLADLMTIHFQETSHSLGVNEVKLDADVTLLYGSGWIAIRGLPGGARVDVYALDGSRVISEPGYDGGEIDINGLPAGVYVVNSGSHSFKFIK